MLTRYGHARIKVNGDEFFLSPTLINVSSIGTPKEIIETVHGLASYKYNQAQAYLCACLILDACGLPQDVTGGIDYSQRQNKHLIAPGKLPVEDVFTLAWHCVKHGICGPQDDDQDGEPIDEFESDRFIMMAVEHLGLSLSESQALTRTQFVSLIAAKYPEKDADKTATKADVEEAEDWSERAAQRLIEKFGENKDGD